MRRGRLFPGYLGVTESFRGKRPLGLKVVGTRAPEHRPALAPESWLLVGFGDRTPVDRNVTNGHSSKD